MGLGLCIAVYGERAVAMLRCVLCLVYSVEPRPRVRYYWVCRGVPCEAARHFK